MGVFRNLSNGRSGAVGSMGAMSLPALIMAVGASLDYGRAELARAQMQAAADAAVLSITQAQILVTGTPEDAVEPFVDAYLSDLETLTVTSIDVVQDDDGYARVEIDGTVDMLLLDMLGHSAFTVSVVSEAQYDLTFDLEFTIALDNSASMLFAATPEDITVMEARHNCAFACHFPGRDTYSWARDNGVQLRLGAGQDAILDAFDIAVNHEFADHADIHFDVYSFDWTLAHVGEGSIDTGLDELETAVRAIGPDATPRGFDQYAATNYEEAFDVLAPIVIDRARDYPDRDHFLLLITDGVADYKPNNTGGGRRIEPFDPELCEEIRAAGVRVGVIYTTYFEFPSNGFWRSRVRPFTDVIDDRLRECSSDTWFFEAQYADDIHNAIERMMLQAIPMPTLTE